MKGYIIRAADCFAVGNAVIVVPSEVVEIEWQASGLNSAVFSTREEALAELNRLRFDLRKQLVHGIDMLTPINPRRAKKGKRKSKGKRRGKCGPRRVPRRRKAAVAEAVSAAE